MPQTLSIMDFLSMSVLGLLLVLIRGRNLRIRKNLL